MGNSSSLSNEAKAYLKGKSLNLDGLLGDLDQHVVRVVDVIELQDIPPEKRKIALAISGGGASGAYEAGVLEALLRKFKEKKSERRSFGRNFRRRSEYLRRLFGKDGKTQFAVV